MNQKFRAYLYRILLAASPLLGVYSLADQNKTALWVGLGAAILGNGIAAFNTDTTRVWIYGVAGAASALAVAYNLLDQEEATLWVGVISSIVGNGLATVNTSVKYPDAIDVTRDHELNAIDAGRLENTDNGPRPEDGDQPEDDAQ
jgi:hypothetical protein